jgi:hypothetical protein
MRSSCSASSSSCSKSVGAAGRFCFHQLLARSAWRPARLPIWIFTSRFQPLNEVKCIFDVTSLEVLNTFFDRTMQRRAVFSVEVIAAAGQHFIHGDQFDVTVGQVRGFIENNATLADPSTKRLLHGLHLSTVGGSEPRTLEVERVPRVRGRRAAQRSEGQEGRGQPASECTAILGSAAKEEGRLPIQRRGPRPRKAFRTARTQTRSGSQTNSRWLCVRRRSVATGVAESRFHQDHRWATDPRAPAGVAEKFS